MLKPVKIRPGHDNFFTPLRFIFAYMVLIGHAFVVKSGASEAEPHLFFGLTASYTAVNLFFIASGFLVTGSILYRKRVSSFVSARILRIFPALIVHVFLLIFVFGPLVTDLPIREYLLHKDTLKQPFLVLSFVDTSMHLPGILSHNAEHQASASLWTLRYELLAYLGTLITYCLGLLKYRWMVFAQFIVLALGYSLSKTFGLYDDLLPTFQSILRFGMCYGLGAVIYVYKDKLQFHLLGVLTVVAISFVLFRALPEYKLDETVLTIALGYVLFYLAYVNIPMLNGLKKLGDLSYGIYIYHWAVLQGLLYFWIDIKVWQLVVFATPITWVLAYLSWHVVEKPALSMKDKFALWLKPNTKEPLALNM